MLETSYILNLGQLLKMAIELKKYLWQKMKLNKSYCVTKIVFFKTIPFIVLEVVITAIVIDNHMAIIQVVEVVLLDGGYGINIIIKQ